MSRRRSFHTLTALATMAIWMNAASAIYINPVPNPSGLAQDIADGTFPAAGIIGNNGGVGGAFNPFCSGTLLQSNILPAQSFALTAGHCTIGGDAAGRFQLTGTSGAVQSSNMVRRHTNFNADGNLGNDVQVMRLSALVNTVTPLSITRTALANNTGTVEVGFGTTAPGAGFPTKRSASFTVAGFTATGFNSNNRFQMNTPGNGTNANPTRHSCAGDSGGPYVVGGQIVGVHSDGFAPGGGAGVCDGTQASQVAANVTNPFIYNYIDSYTQRTIFWDNVRINGGLVDGFENGPANYAGGGNGRANNWNLANDNSVRHNVLGVVTGTGTDNNWRYFNSIGRTNGGAPELYTEGNSSQAEMMLDNAMASLIFRDFPVAGGVIPIQVDQRWNSVGLADDMGLVALDAGGNPLPQFIGADGKINPIWSGFVLSNGGNLDQWFTRTMNFDATGAASVRIYLLNVPEPGTLVLLAAGAFILLRRRKTMR